MELLSVRIDVLERLYKLKGRLNLMISQVLIVLFINNFNLFDLLLDKTYK